MEVKIKFSFEESDNFWDAANVFFTFYPGINVSTHLQHALYAKFRKYDITIGEFLSLNRDDIKCGRATMNLFVAMQRFLKERTINDEFTASDYVVWRNIQIVV